MTRRFTLLIAALLLVLAAACGGGGVEENGGGDDNGGNDIKGGDVTTTTAADDEDEDDPPVTQADDEDEDADNGGDDVPDGQDPNQILGEDDDFDAFIEDCFDGNLFACDALFLITPGGSDQEAYAETCGGRVESGDVPGGGCAEEFNQDVPEGVEPGDLGDDVDLDRSADGCFGGDFEDCQSLFSDSGVDTDYEQYAQACGGRLPNNDIIFTSGAVLDATCAAIFE